MLRRFQTFLHISIVLGGLTAHVVPLDNPELPPKYPQIFLHDNLKQNQVCPGGNRHHNTILTNEQCYDGFDNGQLIQITTTPPISVCFNLQQYRTLWVQHILNETIGGCTKAYTWKSDFFIDLNTDFLYYSAVPQNLQKGHLAPRCDFNDEQSRNDTYYYLNAVPMVQNLNAGGWGQIEDQLRGIVNSNGGTHGVLVRTIPYGLQCLVQGRLVVPSHVIKIIAPWVDLFHNYVAEIILVGDNQLGGAITEPVVIPECQQVTCTGFGTYPRIFCCLPNGEIIEHLGAQDLLFSKEVNSTLK